MQSTVSRVPRLSFLGYPTDTRQVEYEHFYCNNTSRKDSSGIVKWGMKSPLCGLDTVPTMGERWQFRWQWVAYPEWVLCSCNKNSLKMVYFSWIRHSRNQKGFKKASTSSGDVLFFQFVAYQVKCPRHYEAPPRPRPPCAGWLYRGQRGGWRPINHGRQWRGRPQDRTLHHTLERGSYQSVWKPNHTACLAAFWSQAILFWRSSNWANTLDFRY